MNWCTDNRDTFEQKYNQYIANNDYNGAIAYLKSFNVPKEKLPEFNAGIRELETKAQIYNMALSKPWVNQEKIRFWEDYRNGNDLTNKGGIYDEFINSIQSLGDPESDKLEIMFEGYSHNGVGGYDNGFDLFKKQLGLNDDQTRAYNQLQSLGITTNVTSKGFVISIDKSNSNIGKIFKALHDTDTNHTIVGGNVPIQEGVLGEHRWRFNTYTTNSKVSVVDDSRPAEIRSFQGIYVPSMYSIGQERSVDSALRILQDAENEYNRALGLDFEGDTKTIPLQKLGIKTAYIQAIYDDWQDGMLTNEQYNIKTKNAEEAIMNHILGANYTQYNVYGNDITKDDAARGVFDKYDDSQKYAIRDIIAAAKKSGGNVQYEMARLGDKLGLWVGVSMVGDDETDTNYREFFIEDFTKGASNADNRLYNDNRTIASLDMGRLMMYHTPLSVGNSDTTSEWLEPIYAENGDTDYTAVRHFTQQGNNPATEEIISVDEALRLRNKRIIVDQAIDYALRSNYDPNGNYSENKNMRLQIENLLDNALEELFPTWMQEIRTGKTLGLDTTRYENFINSEKQELLNYILNSVNLLINM